MNVMVNACQAIRTQQKRDHTLKGEIVITSEIESDHLVLCFSDNGCGMDDATLARMFEPFFTTKEVGEGTGLGLSISYGIIQKHEGKISVTSTLGEGAEFVITLPKYPEDALE